MEKYGKELKEYESSEPIHDKEFENIKEFWKNAWSYNGFNEEPDRIPFDVIITEYLY
jgi:hypothetical protein